MQRKIRLMIGILIMTGLIAGCWKVSKNLQKELKEEMETIGEAEKSARIVVLDAGHGGTDSGKVGIYGVKEKDINLTITNSVKKILEKENIQVIMTRETDEQLAQSKVEDLKYRVKIMNEVSPVLAVSIHQNSYHEENVFGAQVFYYQTSTEGEKAAGIIQDALQKVNPDNTWINVADEEKDPTSILNYFKKVVSFRKENPSLIYGSYHLLDAENPQS